MHQHSTRYKDSALTNALHATKTVHFASCERLQRQCTLHRVSASLCVVLVTAVVVSTRLAFVSFVLLSCAPTQFGLLERLGLSEGCAKTAPPKKLG